MPTSSESAIDTEDANLSPSSSSKQLSSEKHKKKHKDKEEKDGKKKKPKKSKNMSQESIDSVVDSGDAATPESAEPVEEDESKSQKRRSSSSSKNKSKKLAKEESGESMASDAGPEGDEPEVGDAGVEAQASPEPADVPDAEEPQEEVDAEYIVEEPVEKMDTDLGPTSEDEIQGVKVSVDIEKPVHVGETIKEEEEPEEAEQDLPHEGLEPELPEEEATEEVPTAEVTLVSKKPKGEQTQEPVPAEGVEGETDEMDAESSEEPATFTARLGGEVVPEAAPNTADDDDVEMSEEEAQVTQVVKLPSRPAEEDSAQKPQVSEEEPTEDTGVETSRPDQTEQDTKSGEPALKEADDEEPAVSKPQVAEEVEWVSESEESLGENDSPEESPDKEIQPEAEVNGEGDAAPADDTSKEVEPDQKTAPEDGNEFEEPQQLSAAGPETEEDKVRGHSPLQRTDGQEVRSQDADDLEIPAEEKIVAPKQGPETDDAITNEKHVTFGGEIQREISDEDEQMESHVKPEEEPLSKHELELLHSTAKAPGAEMEVPQEESPVMPELPEQGAAEVVAEPAEPYTDTHGDPSLRANVAVQTPDSLLTSGPAPAGDRPHDPVFAALDRSSEEGVYQTTDSEPPRPDAAPAEITIHAPTEPMLYKFAKAPVTAPKTAPKPSPPAPSAAPSSTGGTPGVRPPPGFSAPPPPPLPPTCASTEAPHQMTGAPPPGVFRVPVVAPYAERMGQTTQSAAYSSQMAVLGGEVQVPASSGAASLQSLASPQAPAFARGRSPISPVRPPVPTKPQAPSPSAGYQTVSAPDPALLAAPPSPVPASPPVANSAPWYNNDEIHAVRVRTVTKKPGHVTVSALTRKLNMPPLASHDAPEYTTETIIIEDLSQPRQDTSMKSEQTQQISTVQQSYQRQDSSTPSTPSGFASVKAPVSPLPQHPASTQQAIQESSAATYKSEKALSFAPVQAPASPVPPAAQESEDLPRGVSNIIKSIESNAISTYKSDRPPGFAPVRPPVSPAPRSPAPVSPAPVSQLQRSYSGGAVSTTTSSQLTADTTWKAQQMEWSSRAERRFEESQPAVAPPGVVLTYVARAGPARHQQWAPVQESQQQWQQEQRSSQWTTSQTTCSVGEQPRVVLPRRSASSVGEMRRKLDSETREQRQTQDLFRHLARERQSSAPPAPLPPYPEPARPRQMLRAPTPSKFIPGHFSGSEYSSELDERIPTRWWPDGYEYIDRRRILVSLPEARGRQRRGRSATPPSVFDRPGPVRETPPERPPVVGMPITRGRTMMRGSRTVQRSASAPPRRMPSPVTPRAPRERAPGRSEMDGSWQRREVRQEVTRSQQGGWSSQRRSPVPPPKPVSVPKLVAPPEPAPPPCVTNGISRTASEISQSMQKMTSESTFLKKIETTPQPPPVVQPVVKPVAPPKPAPQSISETGQTGYRSSKIITSTTEQSGYQQQQHQQQLLQQQYQQQQQLKQQQEQQQQELLKKQQQQLLKEQQHQQQLKEQQQRQLKEQQYQQEQEQRLLKEQQLQQLKEQQQQQLLKEQQRVQQFQEQQQRILKEQQYQQEQEQRLLKEQQLRQLKEQQQQLLLKEQQRVQQLQEQQQRILKEQQYQQEQEQRLLKEQQLRQLKEQQQQQLLKEQQRVQQLQEQQQRILKEQQYQQEQEQRLLKEQQLRQLKEQHQQQLLKEQQRVQQLQEQQERVLKEQQYQQEQEQRLLQEQQQRQLKEQQQKQLLEEQQRQQQLMEQQQRILKEQQYQQEQEQRLLQEKQQRQLKEQQQQQLLEEQQRQQQLMEQQQRILKEQQYQQQIKEQQQRQQQLKEQQQRLLEERQQRLFKEQQEQRLREQQQRLLKEQQQQQTVVRVPTPVFRPPQQAVLPHTSLTQLGVNQQNFCDKQKTHESLDGPGVRGFRDTAAMESRQFNRQQTGGSTRVEMRVEKTFEERMEKTEFMDASGRTVTMSTSLPSSAPRPSHLALPPASPQPIVTSPVPDRASPAPSFQRGWQQRTSVSSSGRGRASPCGYASDAGGYVSEPELASLPPHRHVAPPSVPPRGSHSQTVTRGYTGSLDRRTVGHTPPSALALNRTSSDASDYESHLSTKWTPAGQSHRTSSPFRPVQAPAPAAGNASRGQQWSESMSKARESSSQEGNTTTHTKQEFHSQKMMREETTSSVLPAGAVSRMTLQSPLPPRAIQPRSPLLLRAAPPSAGTSRQDQEEVSSVADAEETGCSLPGEEAVVSFPATSSSPVSWTADSESETSDEIRGGPLPRLAR